MTKVEIKGACIEVSLFIPCLVNLLMPKIGDSTAATLERCGVSVSYRGEVCCGQPAFNSGHWEEAKKMARRFLDVYRDADSIVCPSGSCVSMVRKQYPRLFADEPKYHDKALSLGGRLFEFTEFLIKQMGLSELDAFFPGKVTIHDSCHLNRELGIKEETRALLRMVRGLEIVEMEESDRCCGFGGVFSVKFPEISAAMASKKADNIISTGVETVIVSDPGCIMQIKGYLEKRQEKQRVLHIAELLNEAMAH